MPKKNFSAAAQRPNILTEDPFGFYPARTFEEVTGVTGISANYVFPGGMTGFEFMEELTAKKLFFSNPDRLQGLQKAWGQLVTLNPMLAAVEFDNGNPLLMREAVRSVCRQLNLDDIRELLDIWKTHTGKMETYLDWSDPEDRKYFGFKGFKRDIDWDQLLTPLPKGEWPVSSNWAFSVRTLEKIITQMEKLAPVAPQEISHSRRCFYMYPAKELEDALGVSGFAGKYTFPDGMTGEEYYIRSITVPGLDIYDYINGHQQVAEVPEKLMTQLRDRWDRLVALNPALQAVHPDRDNALNLYDSISGACSLFNVDDINYWLARTPFALWTEADKKKNDELFELEKPVEQKIRQFLPDDDNRVIWWIACPATVKKIEAKLEQRIAKLQPKSRTTALQP